MILHNQSSIEIENLTIQTPVSLLEVERITRPAYERSLAEMQEYWRNRVKQEKKAKQTGDGTTQTNEVENRPALR